MKQLAFAPHLYQIFTPQVLISSFIVSFIYLSILLYTPNYRLLETLLYNDYALSAKMSIISSLFVGGITTQSTVDLILLLLTSLLIGLNITLLINGYNSVRKNGKTHFTVGGTVVLGFISSSCAVMCGFSLLPLLGTALGASFSVFGGVTFRLITVLLLALSLFYTLSTMHPELRKKKNY